MATFALLRTCSRGTRCLLLKVQQSTSPGISHDLSSRIFSTSSSSSGALDYFRARRGPFTPEEKRGSHMMMASTHWKVERFVAIGMIGIMPAALFMQGPMIDHLFCTFVYLHGHWGMRGVLTDYLVKFVPWIQHVWTVFSVLGFAGFIHFNFHDVGFTKAIQMIWSL